MNNCHALIKLAQDRAEIIHRMRKRHFDGGVSLMRFISYRLLGADFEGLPSDHTDQRGRIVLHPETSTDVRASAQFTDPCGSGKWRITIERLEP